MYRFWPLEAAGEQPLSGASGLNDDQVATRVDEERGFHPVAPDPLSAPAGSSGEGHHIGFIRFQSIGSVDSSTIDRRAIFFEYISNSGPSV
jgi:hypothetical protein